MENKQVSDGEGRLSCRNSEDKEQQQRQNTRLGVSAKAVAACNQQTESTSYEKSTEKADLKDRKVRLQTPGKRLTLHKPQNQGSRRLRLPSCEIASLRALL